MADHIIDMGPEGGSAGGMVQFIGTPEEMIKKSKTHTAQFLAIEMK
jgi:excinuclease ABC subunit A